MSLLNHLKLVGRGAEAEMVTLDTVAKNPAIVETLDLDTMRPLMSQLAMAQGALRSRWFIVSTQTALAPPPTSPEPPDRKLKVGEAAERLGVAPITLYRHADEYPFTERPRPHSLRFSERGIEKYLREKRT